tara:strand:+ start:485 stop:850 length:366 start_codon:yes stop_codon:yes gene_type:complete
VAHFAEIDSNNVVLRVIVVDNSDTAMADGTETESIGIAHCQKLFGGTWVQTSYNATQRKNFASKGYTYDSGRNAFIPPKPYNSWVLDDSTCRWVAPVNAPSDASKENPYTWNEETTSWVKV